MHHTFLYLNHHRQRHRGHPLVLFLVKVYVHLFSIIFDPQFFPWPSKEIVQSLPMLTIETGKSVKMTNGSYSAARMGLHV
jgi:hypothetical protein